MLNRLEIGRTRYTVCLFRSVQIDWLSILEATTVCVEALFDVIGHVGLGSHSIICPLS